MEWDLTNGYNMLGERILSSAADYSLHTYNIDVFIHLDCYLDATTGYEGTHIM